MSKKKRWNFWMDERGVALPLFIIFIPIFLVSSVFAVDLTKALMFRHQLQSIADSLSLAGASARSVDPIWGNGYTVTGYEGADHQPQIQDSAPAITGYTPIIDPLGAQNEAQSALLKNNTLIQQMSQSGELFMNWEGHVENNTKFTVTVTGEMHTVMWGKVKNMLGYSGGDIIPVQVKSTAGIENVN